MKSKNKTTAIILCCGAFIGLGGLHDFYLGKNVMGVIKLLTLNFLWIGAILDLIKLKNGTYYDFKAKTSSGTLVDIDPERISDEGICWKVGSDKQIDWAERVVKGLISGTEKITSHGVENGSITEEEKEQILYSLENNIIYQSDANWWIDTRDNPITDKLLEICDGDLEEIIRKL